MRTVIVPPASATSLSTFAGSAVVLKATVYLVPAGPEARTEAVAPEARQSVAVKAKKAAEALTTHSL
jgi:hypothetical protein